ncbi:MAG: tRNA (adenosine(37)-N6)-threonylcarbamoyltransferase complex ATPase subunit type 1 TsaE [Oscillospiraceae bacterium]|nr:tRNA (adenosine(37)-N6)-threonylcarbamoyltransferase complex ATPase subunit type 1 TsaE [Oscillospiraceae bacterium]
MMTNERTTATQAETEAAGGDYARTLRPGDVVALRGELGAGKTAFVRGALRALGWDGPVASPTFAIVNEYETALGRVAHFDMYRIENEDALWSTGFYDYLDGSAVVFIEWSENIAFALDFPHRTVSIAGEGDGPRRIVYTEAQP